MFPISIANKLRKLKHSKVSATMHHSIIVSSKDTLQNPVDIQYNIRYELAKISIQDNTEIAATSEEFTYVSWKHFLVVFLFSFSLVCSNFSIVGCQKPQIYFTVFLQIKQAGGWIQCIQKHRQKNVEKNTKSKKKYNKHWQNTGQAEFQANMQISFFSQLCRSMALVLAFFMCSY